MTKFKIKKNRLRDYLKYCSMKGTYTFEKKKGIKKEFFSSYFLDVNPDGMLNVLTMNKKRKTSAEFTLRDVEVLEDGIIEITDSETILSVLKSSSLGDDLEVISNDHIITIKDGTKDIELEQLECTDIEALKDSKIVKMLGLWSEHHNYDEDGILTLSKDHPATKVDIPYPMKITAKKKDLEPLVGIVVNIIKDSKTRLVCDGKEILAHSGQANSRLKLKNCVVPFMNHGKELLEFDEEFYSMQCIIPNLFDVIEINAKFPSNKSCINLFIKSEDPKLRMITKIAFSSIIEKEE